MEGPWILLINAEIVSWSWRQRDILERCLLSSAKMNIVKASQLRGFVILIVVVRAWGVLSSSRLYINKMLSDWLIFKRKIVVNLPLPHKSNCLALDYEKAGTRFLVFCMPFSTS